MAGESLNGGFREPISSRELIERAMIAEGEDPSKIRIWVDGDMPAEMGYDPELAVERAQALLADVLSKQEEK